jgi:hypothetical protein
MSLTGTMLRVSRTRFTPEEDRILCILVNQFDTKSWKIIASHLPGRTARQCRDRWRNYFQGSGPEIPWTAHENIIFWGAVKLHGPRWSIIEPMLRHRSRSDLRRHWIFGASQLQKRTESEKAPHRESRQFAFPSPVIMGPGSQVSRPDQDFDSMVWDNRTEFWFEITNETHRDWD